VGGAERSARTRRQQQVAGSRAVAQARGGDQKKIIAVVIGVALLAAAVIGGVLWTNASKNATAGQAIAPITTQAQVGGVVEKRNGVVVSVGKPGAKTTIDIYADFLCPICGQFQKTYGQQIEQQINAGNLQVNYHMVPLLNSSSNPPGFSLDAANAALAAADAGKFTAFHDSLYASQPQEGKRGYDNAQLIKLGQDLGITNPKFAQEVNSGTYDQQINAAFQQTLNDPNLQQNFGQGASFGTPTVAVNGKAIPLSQGWLDQLIAAKGQS
jgi:protein-disulfide isomerase